LTTDDELHPTLAQDIGLIFAPSHILTCPFLMLAFQTRPMPGEQSSNNEVRIIFDTSTKYLSGPSPSTATSLQSHLLLSLPELHAAYATMQ
jgi:hypothetical protein